MIVASGMVSGCIEREGEREREREKVRRDRGAVRKGKNEIERGSLNNNRAGVRNKKTTQTSVHAHTHTLKLQECNSGPSS